MPAAKTTVKKAAKKPAAKVGTLLPAAESPPAKLSVEGPPAKLSVDKRADRDLSPEAQKRRAETCRLRVHTSELIDRLQRHAMGKIGMTPTQLAAAQTLLRKTLPDLIGVKSELEVSPVVFNFHMIMAPPKE